MNSLFKDLLIFEMANNHQGSVDHGRRIVSEMARLARQHGVRAAVKLQYRDLDTFVHPDARGRDDVKHVKRFEETRLEEREFRALVDAIRDEGLVTMVTPFDERSVGMCLDHGVDVIKVASCSATDWPLLEEIVKTRRPVIVSTGGVGLTDIDSIATFFGHRDADFALMHCVGIYPAPAGNLCMNFLAKLSRRYPGVAIGYSGHEAPDDLDAVKMAVAKGATLFERHVGVPTDAISLNKYSLSPVQVDTWIGAIQEARTVCGDGEEKRVTQEEIDALQSLKRGVYAARHLEKGTRIERDDVFFAMPCVEGQLDSGQFGRYRAVYEASRDYEPNAPVFERSQPDEIGLVRRIVHDAKGMLYEAQVILGPDVEIELSHHFGLDQFRRFGTVIVNVINRRYCKKLLLLFPGQQHPRHAHRTKEETFQLLWGDLDLEVEGTEHHLRPGDLILVEPGQMHSFSSRQGAVLEELSTTHQRTDSVYEDETIQCMDPLERKTILNSW